MDDFIWRLAQTESHEVRRAMAVLWWVFRPYGHIPTAAPSPDTHSRGEWEGTWYSTVKQVTPM